MCSMRSISIRGDGVAARCCGHLLTQAGYQVSFDPGNRPRVPMIMLGEAAQALIRDIFQRDDLFRDLPVIRKRIVAWGAPPIELDHSGVVVSEEFLLNSLGDISSADRQADWTILATPPPPASTADHRFGSRIASPLRVEMKETAPKDTCWIESLHDGWLFLNSGWLLAVGAQPTELLRSSKLIREQIASSEPHAAHFPASPRIVTPLGGEGWICCGTAAMSFDPLCGDGTAHAVREAILASAVIRAADDGEDAASLLSHYQARLIAGFERHLLQCRDFYSSGGSEDWWRKEVVSIMDGLAWCRRQHDGKFRYRLAGLELQRL
jgi:hypothetical protein